MPVEDATVRTVHEHVSWQHLYNMYLGPYRWYCRCPHGTPILLVLYLGLLGAATALAMSARHRNRHPKRHATLASCRTLFASRISTSKGKKYYEQSEHENRCITSIALASPSPSPDISVAVHHWPTARVLFPARSPGRIEVKFHPGRLCSAHRS